ncbi:MAG: leucine-rich repeat domain-containing protein, partial [Candidatus Marinimicrobia bacterium]|nr:leucine-rich repeat domain-containing protein [Candidatus Neomarinimicrobiota bacterium]
LYLSNNQLTGSIPLELSNLTNLQVLWLSSNELTGSIPPELGNLTNLERLWLSDNQLTGSIPSELGNLTNLQMLWLYDNQLTGSIPSELGDLTNLTYLELSYNQLTGSIPAELGNLTNLQELNLYYNQLTGSIPGELCNLSLNWNNIYSFNITQNQFCPPYPECMADYVGEQDITNCEITPVHFTDLPDNTGEFHLVYIESAIGLEPGDEIGLFDSQGFINSGDCSDTIGEILVGAGIWEGTPQGIVGIGSIDYCDIGGFQFPGYTDGNPIVIRVWNTIDDMERGVTATYSSGEGIWGETLTVVSFEVNYEVELNLSLEPFMNNLISINVELVDPSIQSVFGDNLLIASNDQGEFYVPSLNYNSIGNVDILEGYTSFTVVDELLTVPLTGLPVDPYQTITIHPFMNNLLSYLPQESMLSVSAFGDYDNEILIVSNDQGEFYIPSYGIFMLTTLFPGKGYRIFLNSDTSIDFVYPSPELTRNFGQDIADIELYKSESVSQRYDIQKTGLSTPIVITSINGDIEPGDELVVYAHGEVIGATRVINTDSPILITAWAGFHEYDIDLPGYEPYDEIDIRLWKSSENREVKIITELDNPYFGQSPLIAGALIVTSKDIIPQSFILHPAYPNPFNPITTVSYDLPVDSHVTISVYDLAGHLIAELIDENRTAGTYQVNWKAQNQSSGVYLVKMVAGDFQSVQKVMLVK